jgi:hypothetical protein
VPYRQLQVLGQYPQNPNGDISQNDILLYLP